MDFLRETDSDFVVSLYSSLPYSLSFLGIWRVYIKPEICVCVYVWAWMQATGLGRAATRWLLTAATAPSPTGVAGRRPKLPRGPLLLRPLPSFMMFNLSC